MMTLSTLKRVVLASLLAAALTPAMADAPVEHPVIKRPYKLAPSADLVYSIKAKQRGIGLSGESVSNWRAGDGKYSLLAETKAALFGKILEQRSEGTVDDFGLAPSQFVEKRFRKEAATTTFKRDSKTIVFSEGDDSYPLKGGEQDRNSTVWQLVSVARATRGCAGDAPEGRGFPRRDRGWAAQGDGWTQASYSSAQVRSTLTGAIVGQNGSPQ